MPWKVCVSRFRPGRVPCRADFGRFPPGKLLPPAMHYHTILPPFEYAHSGPEFRVACPQSGQELRSPYSEPFSEKAGNCEKVYCSHLTA